MRARPSACSGERRVRPISARRAPTIGIADRSPRSVRARGRPPRLRPRRLHDRRWTDGRRADHRRSLRRMGGERERDRLPRERRAAAPRSGSRSLRPPTLDDLLRGPRVRRFRGTADDDTADYTGGGGGLAVREGGLQPHASPRAMALKGTWIAGPPSRTPRCGRPPGAVIASVGELYLAPKANAYGSFCACSRISAQRAPRRGWLERLGYFRHLRHLRCPGRRGTRRSRR